MPHSELTKLRAKRTRIHRQLDKLEPLVAGYRLVLRDTEARIREIAPELPLQLRRRVPNPVFQRGELRRFMLDILREAGEPLPVAVIAVRALARKGVALPDPTLRRRTRQQVRLALLAERLKEHGLTKESEGTIKAKLKRGAFSATFLLATLAALELEEVRLEDL